MSHHNRSFKSSTWRKKCVKSIKKYRKALNSLISSVSELRYNCILNPDLNISKKFEDLVKIQWQPLSTHILRFDSKINSFYIDFIARKNKDNLLLMSNDEEEKAADTCSSSSFDLDEELPPPMSFDFNEDLIPPIEFSIDSEQFIPSFDTELSDLPPEVSQVPQIVEDLVDDPVLPLNPCPEINLDSTNLAVKTEIFEIILDNFYKSEKIYRGILFCLNMFFESIISSFQNDQSNFILQECQKIFGKIPDILKFHTRWLETFENKLKSGDEFNTLTTFFISFREELLTYKIHALTAQSCFDTLNKLWGHKEFGRVVPKVIDTPDIKISFEDAIQRPTTRISEYFAILTDIISRVPKTDNIYEALDETKEDIGIFFEVLRLNPKDKKAFTRTIVKWTTVVEDFGGEARRHRLIVLFSDYLICAGENMKNSYSLKWHCSLMKIKLLEDIKDQKQRGPDFVPLPKVSIEQLKDEIFKLEEDIALLDQRKSAKRFEKLKASLDHLSSQLVLKYPSHPLYIYLADGKRITLLFMTEATRNFWERLIRIRKNSNLFDYRPIYIGEVNECVDIIGKKLQSTLKEQNTGTLGPDSKITNPSSNDSAGSLARFNGKLFIKGLIYRYESSCPEISLNFELDKHIKGYKPNNKNSKIGVSNPDIIYLELENSPGYLYITSSRAKGKPDASGIFVIYLASEKVKTVPFVRKKKSFKWGEVLVFLEFSESGSESVHINNFNPFNPSLESIVACENLEIPTIISYPIKIINTKALDEVGIYRVPGTASKIALLKQIWIDGFIINESDLDNFDYHVIAGVFKQFLREIKDPLIAYEVTEKLISFDYQNGTYAMFEEILMFMHEVNRKVFIMVLDHLVKLADHQNENKMSFSNISIVFGVNLIKKKSHDTNNPGPEMLDTSVQISTFTKILDLWKRSSIEREVLD